MTEEEFGRLKPSELILVALADLEKVEKDPNYKVDMLTYHAMKDTRCSVCFAGAAMAVSLDCCIDENLIPSDFINPVRGNLAALNMFRRGSVPTALFQMGISSSRGLEFVRPITDYHTKPERFKKEIRELAQDLASANL